jgi:hypothetical protein
MNNIYIYRGKNERNSILFFFLSFLPLSLSLSLYIYIYIYIVFLLFISSLHVVRTGNGIFAGKKT